MAKLLKFDFTTADEKKAFVDSCEAEFEAMLDEAVAKVMARKELHIITLSGPTCSGKTTTARKLIDELTAAGRDVHVVSIDDFYYDRKFLDERAARLGIAVDFDSVDTIDLEALSDCVSAIVRGEDVNVPHYNFKSGTRVKGRLIDVKEESVFIFEGIQAIYPEVAALFKGLDTVSIHISVAEDAICNGKLFEKRDIRFFRRLVRDYKFRGASVDFTFFLWKSVCANEDAHILPYMDSADIKLSSLMSYELAMIKKPLMDTLATVNSDSEIYGKVCQIKQAFDGIPELSQSLLPQFSVYREFLG